MLKRRRKLSKDLQIRKKLLPLQKISGISAKLLKQAWQVLLSICIFFAEDKRHWCNRHRRELRNHLVNSSTEYARQLNTLVN